MSLSTSSSSPSDPRTEARRLLTDAISTYLQSCKDLAAATERATETSGSIDTQARRKAYQTLTELGDQVRLAQRRLVTAAKQARRVMPVAEIEEVAKKLDKRDTTESAAVLVKAALVN
ncbi:MULTISPECIES: hypothetical protein [Azospirillum]|uniref:Uncharacterized protein n=5 Tax=Azospirillum TaxID=191 RepID=A0A560BJN9_AZOBR|nr:MULTISPECIES: hypothetical protein [Azospirillum]MBB3264603.1 hypothetical protein [Azospirillum sp. OGB3]MBY3755912.1 hypothetical protein [Azospirillum formosense]AIB14880.1 hypothetical protein ABAZ39_23600 [Azospirillum argentinense]AWJ94216.1 hypothetical protein Sp245p_30955 [Azospirillum baldaniorum]EZQ04640.1 hypothetical protein ABAZ39_25880 [Azospirillum argentinense]